MGKRPRHTAYVLFIRLTLEQHGCELCRFTCMAILKSTCAVHTVMPCRGQLVVGNLSLPRADLSYIQLFNCGDSQCPVPLYFSRV